MIGKNNEKIVDLMKIYRKIVFKLSIMDVKWTPGIMSLNLVTQTLKTKL